MLVLKTPKFPFKINWLLDNILVLVFGHRCNYGHTEAKSLILCGPKIPNIYLGCGCTELVYYRNSGSIMENKGVSTKMGADNLAESTPNAPKSVSPICLPKPRSSEFQWKKASLGVPSPWIWGWMNVCPVSEILVLDRTEHERGKLRVVIKLSENCLRVAKESFSRIPVVLGYFDINQ